MKTLKEAILGESLFNKKNLEKQKETSPSNRKYEFTGETMK